MRGVSKVFLGADHAGYARKEEIAKYLKQKKIKYIDMTPNLVEGDDYPFAAFKVAEKVVKNKKSRGILVCGSGTGMVIAANKVSGARAEEPYDKYTAEMSRKDNDSNIIGMRGRGFPLNKAKKILDVWLKTEFSEQDRHKRRIKEIRDYERK